ncbi:hypothetical protein [Providencia hangzhouensis]
MNCGFSLTTKIDITNLKRYRFKWL